MEKSNNSLKMADSLQDTNNNLIFMEDRSGRSKDVKTFDDKDNDQIANLEMHIKELTEQNMTLKDKLTESREDGKKMEWELLRSRERCQELEKSKNVDIEMNENIVKKLQQEKGELDKEVQALTKDLVSFNSGYDVNTIDLIRELSQTKQEIQESRENCKSLEEQNNSLKKDLQEVTKRIETMQGEYEAEKESGWKNGSLLRKLDLIREQLKGYRENVSGLENEVQFYKDKFDFCSNELETKKRQMEEMKESYDVMSKDKLRLEGQLSQSQIELEKSEANLDDLEAENQLFKKRIEELEKETCNLGNDSAKQTEVLSKANKRDVESLDDVLFLRQLVEDLEKELLFVSRKLSDVEADNYGNQIQVQQLNLQLRESLDKITEMESRPAGAEIGEPVNHHAELQQAKRQAQEARFQLRRKEKENKELETKLKETLEQMHKMEVQTNLGEMQRSQLTERLENEREKLLKLQDDFKAYKKTISEQMSSEEFYKQELSNKDAIIAEQKIKAADTELKYHDLSERYNEMKDLHEQHEKEIQEFEDGLLATQKDMADMQRGVTLAESEKQELKQQMLTANKSIADLNSQLRSAEQGVKEKDNEIALVTQRLTRMKEDLKEAVKSKSDLERQIHDSRSNAEKRVNDDDVMQNQIEELQRTCEELRQQLAEKELVVERLKDDKSSLETDLSAVTTELSYNESLNETSADELKRIVVKLKSSEDEITRLTELSEKALQHKGTLEIELSVAHKKIESMEENMKENDEKENNLVKTLQEERKHFVNKEADMASCRSKIASLELQQENVVKENDDLRRKNEELEAKVTALRNQLDEIFNSRDQTMRRKMELEEMVLEIRQDLEESTKAKSQQEEEVQNLSGKMPTYEAQIQALKRQHEELKEKIVEANIQAANQKDELMKLEIAATEHQRIRESAQSCLEQKSKDSEDMQNTIKGLQAELNEVKNDLLTSKMSHEFALDENNRLARKVQEQETKMEHCHKRVSEANEEKIKINAELEAQAAKLNSLNLKLSAAARDKDRCKNELQVVEKKLQKIQEEFLQSQNQVREKERIVQSYKVEIGEKDNQIEQLKSAKASVDEKNLTLKKELQTTAFCYEASESKLKATQGEISCLKRKLDQYETTVDNLLKERDTYNKGNEDFSNQQSNVFLEKNRERQAALEKEIASNNATISKLEHDLKISRQDCLDSQTELSQCRRRLEDLKASNEVCDRERRALREESLEVNKKRSDRERKDENETKGNLALQCQLEDSTKMRDSNRNEIVKLSKQCVEQKSGLDAAKKEIEQKNCQIHELKADKAHLEEKSAELRGHLTAAIGECEKLRGCQQQLQDEIIAQQKSASDVNDRLHKVIKSERDAQDELKLKNSEIESLNDEIAQVNNDSNELKYKERQLQNILNKQQEDLVAANKQLTELHDELLHNKKELRSNENELKDLKDDNCALKEELDQNKDALRRLKIEFQSVQENTAVVNLSLLQSNLYEKDDLAEESEFLQMKHNLKKAEENLQKSMERENSLQDELENLKNTTGQLQDNLQSLKEREGGLKERNEDAEREVLNTKSDLKKSKERLNAVTSQLEIVQKKKEQLETQNNRLEGAKSQLMEELRDERAKTRKAEDELLEAQCKLQELQTEWDHLEKEAECKTAALDTAKSEKKCLEKDAQTLRDELSSTHSLMNSTLKKNRELDAENFQLKRTIADHQTKRGGHDEPQVELSKVAIQHHKLTKDLQLQIHQKQKEISSLKEQLENVNQKLTSAKDDYEELLDDLKERVENFKKLVSEKEARVVLLDNAKTNLEADLKTEALKRKELQDEFDKDERRLNGIIQEKDNRINELEYGLTKLNERIKKLQADRTEMKASSIELESLLQEAQKEIKRLNNEIMSQSPLIAALRAKNAGLDEEKQRLKDDLNKSKRQCSEQVIQLDALKHENERLQEELNEAITPRSSPVKKTPIWRQDSVEPDLNNHKKLLEIESAYRDVILEKEDAEDKNRGLREKCEELDQELSESLTTKDYLEKDNACKDRRIKELEDLLHKSEHSAQLERNELQAAEKAKNDMELELKSTQDAIRGLEECNTAYEETIKQLEDRVAEIQQNNVRLENALEDSQRKLSSQMKQLSEMQKKVSDSETTRQSNASTKDELMRDLQSSKNKIATLEDQLCTSARDQAKASLAVKEMAEKNAQLKKELQQLQSRLKEESYDREMERKDMREKDEALKNIQRQNRELESEISESTKEMNEKTTELLTLLNKQEETQEELEALQRQNSELESSWMQEKGENEKLRLEISASRKLHSDLKIAYDNILDEINSSQEEIDEKDLKKLAEVQKLTVEKEQLNKEIERLNKKVTALKENNEKMQKEKKDVEQKLKMVKQRMSVLEAGANTIDTIKTLQVELEESKEKINDLNAMYEAVKIERVNLRSEKTKPISPRPTSAYLDSLVQKSRIEEHSLAQQDMIDAQARASLLGQKLRVARKRLEGLKTSPLNSTSEADNGSTEDGEVSEVFCEEVEEMGQL
ncbi:putative leucine-rich repeat-containing protein DDB_G0290503 isoform X2 [Montipora capricornis]